MTHPVERLRDRLTVEDAHFAMEHLYDQMLQSFTDIIPSGDATKMIETVNTYKSNKDDLLAAVWKVATASAPEAQPEAPSAMPKVGSGKK